MKLSELIPAANNPRKASKDRLENLKRSIETLGSLDGIVYNKALEKLVSGHQRAKVFPDGQIVITKEYDDIQKDGTIRLGFVQVDHQKIPYREVMWDLQTHNLGMIAANNNAGEWDYKILPDLLLDLDSNNFSLELTGFTNEKLEKILQIDEFKKPLKTLSCPHCGKELQK